MRLEIVCLHCKRLHWAFEKYFIYWVLDPLCGCVSKLKGGKEEAMEKKGAVLASIIFKDCNISAEFLDKWWRRALPSFPLLQDILFSTPSAGGWFHFPTICCGVFYQALAAKKPDFPAGLALARVSPLPKAEIKGFHFMFKDGIGQGPMTGEKGGMARHPKALWAVWDRWNLFLCQSPLLGQLLLLPGDGCCGFVLWKSWGDAEKISCSQLGSGIRKEESNDRSGGQLQGHNLSQKQFKKCGEQFGCCLAKGALATLPGLAITPVRAQSVKPKTQPFVFPWDQDLGQFIFQVAGFPALALALRREGKLCWTRRVALTWDFLSPPCETGACMQQARSHRHQTHPHCQLDFNQTSKGEILSPCLRENRRRCRWSQ